jgi:hypothetical protein
MPHYLRALGCHQRELALTAGADQIDQIGLDLSSESLRYDAVDRARVLRSF